MGPIIKIIIGAILIIASIYYLVAGPAVSWLTGNRPYVDFLILLNGGIPILVFLIGLFVVWLELDELRIERELKAEEKKKKK
jgi:hypothetical protein